MQDSFNFSNILIMEELDYLIDLTSLLIALTTLYL